jgi:hypothetical protein
MTDYNRKGSVSANEGNSWLSEWSRVLDVGTICLFGGEPTMNKDLSGWIQQTRRYFPSSKIKIISNGLYLKHKDILEELFKVGNSELQISLHWRTGEKFEYIKQELIKQLTATDGWKVTAIDKPEVIMAFTKESITVQLAVFGEFVTPYRGYASSMKPWDSKDVSASYANCGSPSNPILYKNRIYKCAPIANLKDTLELHNQFDDADWQPYLKYQGYAPSDNLNELIDNFDKPNKICSMCSDNKTAASVDHYASGNVVEKREIKWLN